jgi:hypothetical protein
MATNFEVQVGIPCCPTPVRSSSSSSSCCQGNVVVIVYVGNGCWAMKREEPQGYFEIFRRETTEITTKKKTCHLDQTSTTRYSIAIDHGRAKQSINHRILGLFRSINSIRFDWARYFFAPCLSALRTRVLPRCNVSSSRCPGLAVYTKTLCGQEFLYSFLSPLLSIPK